MVGQEQGTKVSETQGRFSYLCGVEKGRQLGLGKKWERHESDEGAAFGTAYLRIKGPSKEKEKAAPPSSDSQAECDHAHR